MHSNANAAVRTENITDGFEKFTNLINDENTHRISLKFLWDIGKVNHPTKLDIKIICTLKTDIIKLFEPNQQVADIGMPDAQII